MKTVQDVVEEIIQFNRQQLREGKISAEEAAELEKPFLLIQQSLGKPVHMPLWWHVLNFIFSDRVAYIFCGLCLLTCVVLLMRQ